jgi:hypothetical protein
MARVVLISVGGEDEEAVDRPVGRAEQNERACHAMCMLDKQAIARIRIHLLVPTIKRRARIRGVEGSNHEAGKAQVSLPK